MLFNTMHIIEKAPLALRLSATRCPGTGLGVPWTGPSTPGPVPGTPDRNFSEPGDERPKKPPKAQEISTRSFPRPPPPLESAYPPRPPSPFVLSRGAMWNNKPKLRTSSSTLQPLPSKDETTATESRFGKKLKFFLHCVPPDPYAAGGCRPRTLPRGVLGCNPPLRERPGASGSFGTQT